MTGKSLDQIERELRAMSEPPYESAGQPTELWKRALETARAEAHLEERAGLVHPGAERALPRERRPMTPGRRLLLALNGVGVAAMVVLAAGVWTVMRTPQVTDKADLYADTLESAAPTAPGEGALSLFAEKAVGLDSPSADLALRDRREIGPSELASEDEEIAFTDGRDFGVTRSDAGEALPQMRQAISSGITLGDADASAMAAAPAPGIESAEIVIEVADLAEAKRAIDELPMQGFAAFNSLPIESGLAPSAAVSAREAPEPDEPVVVNVEPTRMDEAIEKLRSLGRVVEEQRAPDSPGARSQKLLDTAAQALTPTTEALQELADAQAENEHARAHRGIALSDEERLAQVRSAIETIARRLDEARRSMNLSQIHVNLRQAPEHAEE